jgi:hypothetical protein
MHKKNGFQQRSESTESDLPWIGERVICTNMIMDMRSRSSEVITRRATLLNLRILLWGPNPSFPFRCPGFAKMMIEAASSHLADRIHLVLSLSGNWGHATHKFCSFTSAADGYDANDFPSTSKLRSIFGNPHGARSKLIGKT